VTRTVSPMITLTKARLAVAAAAVAMVRARKASIDALPDAPLRLTRALHAAEERFWRAAQRLDRLEPGWTP
jgi:hypothetical protein